MAQAHDHISICVCTFKRPEMLAKLLDKVDTQSTKELFTYSVVIVDNDFLQSAKATVEHHREKSGLKIEYHVEPDQNIARARNMAIDKADGNLIAFVDDDEFPAEDWLYRLYETYKLYKVDGVLGPVLPYFEEQPPQWIIKGRFCERISYTTGTVLDDGRTGNVLLSGSIFRNGGNRFDPQFGRTGGEDSEFFENVIKQGRVFVWCNEAPVFEIVPRERWKRSFYLKKSLRIGGLTGEKAVKWPSKYMYLAKTVASLLFYGTVLPVSILAGQHQFMKFLTKAIYCVGCLMGFYGLVAIRYRN